MSEHIYVSTGAFGDLPLQAILQRSLDVGITRIELSSGMPYASNILEIVRSHYPQFDFLVHNYFPPPAQPFVLNLAAFDLESRDRSVALCKQSISLSSELASPFYSVHAGFRALLKPDCLGKPLQYENSVPLDTAYRILSASLRHIIDYARGKNVRILVEPNVLAKYNLINGRNEIALICDYEDMMYLINDLNDPSFGLLLDTGHLNVTARTLGFDRMAFVERVAPYIGAFHVHDNDGITDTHQPVRPGSWVMDILRDLKFSELPIIVEAKFETVDELCRHVEWLRGEIR